MRTAPALLVALTATLALAGCVPDDDPIVLDPEPTATPIFESDEEALAAAEEALAAYYVVSDQILKDGGIGSASLLAVATDEVMQSEQAGHDHLSELGWKAVGSTHFDTMSLQAYDPRAEINDETVIIYVCVDITDFDLVDQSGASVVDPARDNRLPFEIAFVAGADTSTGLRVSRKEVWSGVDFCD